MLARKYHVFCDVITRGTANTIYVYVLINAGNTQLAIVTTKFFCDTRTLNNAFSPVRSECATCTGKPQPRDRITQAIRAARSTGALPPCDSCCSFAYRPRQHTRIAQRVAIVSASRVLPRSLAQRWCRLRGDAKNHILIRVTLNAGAHVS